MKIYKVEDWIFVPINERKGNCMKYRLIEQIPRKGANDYYRRKYQGKSWYTTKEGETTSKTESLNGLILHYYTMVPDRFRNWGQPDDWSVELREEELNGCYNCMYYIEHCGFTGKETKPDNICKEWHEKPEEGID